MVKLYNYNFDFEKCGNIDKSSHQYYQDKFNSFPFELDHFQKYALVGIETEKHVLVTAHTGSGKCLKYDTPVMMSDGTIKPVQDILVNDKLMGDDSTPRNVMGIARGIEHLYNITLSDGDTFGCNESHILCLKINFKPFIQYNDSINEIYVFWFDGKEVEIKRKVFKYKTQDKIFSIIQANNLLDSKLKTQQNYFNISVKDYLKLPEIIKNNSLSYKVAIDFPGKTLEIEPYIMGFWLGENENINEFNNLFKDKHIPHEYKVNSQKNRMELLAGLIDSTGGTYHNNTFDLIVTNEKLSNDIVFLIKSLGFSCKKEFIEDIRLYKVSFTGNHIWEIPILNKNNNTYTKTDSLENALCYSFKVDFLGLGNYYGFELDGNHKFVLGNFIVTHNTMPAEYAITKFCKQGKKVIYTCPIKSLSNQKYHEFTQKFPHVSFGIMTGDIKFNPEADCILMTTEILRNALYNKKGEDNETKKTLMDFNINIEKDVACVIFDEVHYINDQDRGKVWEESIMNMPNNIQMVLLSATIDKEEEFAQWIENTKKRDVWITSTTKRTVPLTHYMYYITNTRFDKHIASSSKSNTSTDINTIKYLNNTTTDTFLDFKKEENYKNLYKLNSYVEKNNLRPKKEDVIKRIVKKIHKHNMLPAICFVFSRKQVEQYAKYIEQNLFELCGENANEINSELKKSNMVDDECKKILMKFPNYREYINLPEYENIVSLLKKGVAIHHSGLLPVLREMIELMFDKGYVKLLFATETFAVGINMPTKTVIFTNMSKYSNSGFRYILPHEYTQMAGRAGRRGLDEFGSVIHLNNMFELPDKHTYNNILSGNPQKLVSKFKVEPHLILKQFEITENNDSETTIVKYLDSSMDHTQQTSYLVQLLHQEKNIIDEIQKKRDSFKIQNIDLNIVKEYVEKKETLRFIKQKKKKIVERRIQQIENIAPRNFITAVSSYKEMISMEESIEDLRSNINSIQQFSSNSYKMMYSILEENKFIDENKLTRKGKIASNINELNSLVISSIIDKNYMDHFDVYDLICFISLFVQVRVSDQYKQYNFDKNLIKLSKDSILADCIDETREISNYYFDIMTKQQVECNQDDYSLLYDIYTLVNEWCYVENEEEAKKVIHKCYEKGIFIGEFVKCLLKIVNITNELNSVAVKTANVKLEYITSEVESKILKFVATNQSLYV